MTWFNKHTNVLFVHILFLIPNIELHNVNYQFSKLNSLQFHDYDYNKYYKNIEVHLVKLAEKEGMVAGVRLFSLTVALYIYTYIIKYIKDEANNF